MINNIQTPLYKNNFLLKNIKKLNKGKSANSKKGTEYLKNLNN